MILHVTDREGQQHRLEVDAGRVLMEVLRDEGFGIEAVCGGCCACATCHVYVAPDQVGERGEVEQELLASCEHFDVETSRLSCQIMVQDLPGELSVIVAPEE